MFTAIIENIKLVGVCASALTACGGGYVYFDLPTPASKQYVIAQNSEIKSRLIDSQLQTNTMQRNLLRKEKFDRDIEIQKSTDASVRSVLQQRLDTINDDLEAVGKERDSLAKEKAAQK